MACEQRRLIELQHGRARLVRGQQRGCALAAMRLPGLTAGAAVTQQAAADEVIEEGAEGEVIGTCLGGIAVDVGVGEELLGRLPVGGAGVGVGAQVVQAPVGAEVGQLQCISGTVE